MADISVIIPVYNDPVGLRETLDSIVEQDFEGDFEILPVDNNSTDNTGEVIEEFEGEYPDLVRGLEENEIQGSYAARNTGIENARGEILVFTDADMWWDKSVLSLVHEEFSKTEVDYLGGNIETVRKDENIYSILGGNRFSNTRKKLEKENFIATAFMAVRREVAEDIGGFDERMFSGADGVFGKEVYREGYNQNFSEDITVYHPATSSFDSFIGRRIRFGEGTYELRKYHPEIGIDRHPLNPRNFLPAAPWRMRTIDGWQEATIKEKISVYFIYWIKKLAEPYGYTKAYFNDRLS